MNNTSTEKPNRVEQLKKIHADALELFARKNADYGDAFAKFGVVGVLMRIEDKIQRALSISARGVVLVNDEGLKDTLLDLHCCAAEPRSKGNFIPRFGRAEPRYLNGQCGGGFPNGS